MAGKPRRSAAEPGRALLVLPAGAEGEQARPAGYCPETAERICERIADGESLRSICSDETMPGLATVRQWLADPAKKSFRLRYADAREALADTIFEEIREIADDAERDLRDDPKRGPVVNGEHLQRAKLRIDARKWMAAKLAPKKYGDKIAARAEKVVEHEPLSPDAAREKIRLYLERRKSGAE